MGLFSRVQSFSELVWALAKSPSARYQLRRILDRRPAPVLPPAPIGHDFIDVKTLLETLTVEELSRTAEEYFQQHPDVDAYVARPFNNVKDAPDLLIAFGQIVAGLRPPYGSTILDFGAGTCWATRLLTQMENAVIALDVSPTALEFGREMFRRLPISGPHAPPSFLVFDGRRFDLPDESVDQIVCLNAFHHVPNAGEVLKEMARVLRPGGIAGFSEPGTGHSRSEQAQYEMRHYTVIENDIVIEDIERWALEAGFSRLELAVFDTHSYRLNWRDYQDLIDGGVSAQAYVDHMKHAARDRRAFFLYKAGTPVPDSREGRGLKGIVRATLDSTHASPGGELSGEVEVVNTGANAWLPSDAPYGPVLVGVQVLARDGALLKRDFARIWLPHGMAPGESARIRFSVPAPPAGEYRLAFDLVSEMVCWFAENGAEPALIDISVHE